MLFDDLRCGVHFDARKEHPGWNLPGFDASGWQNAIPAAAPKGQPRLCAAEPVRPTGRVLRPVSVKPAGTREGYAPHDWAKVFPADESMRRTGLLFDFGENTAGYPRLRVKGAPGQKIELQFAEFETNGDIDYTNINFFPEGFSQRDVYYCGGECEVFEPPFTYHGCRYCLVSGLTPEQLSPDVLEFVVCTSAIPAAGSFRCSDETANTLYEMAERSDRSNFYYFPTDCPHREKNGWTGDAALSAEHMLQTMHCENSFREWLRSVCAAQLPNGFLPCVVPCGVWGENGCGPSWDAVLTELPYQTWRFTGNTAVLAECADAIYKYLGFAAGKRSAEGLVDYGLGDWCPVGGRLKVSTQYTNTVALMDIAAKAARIFGILGQSGRSAHAEAFAEELRRDLRKKYIDPAACVAESGCQTAQSMALYYGLFEPAEIGRAREYLVRTVHENGDFLDVGILGARVLFRELTKAGEAELAYSMVTRPEYPSYGHFIEAGLTAIPESFEVGSETPGNGSANHHMYCDFKGWFISDIAGLHWENCESRTLLVDPHFITKLAFAEGTFDSPFGGICVRWAREGENVRLSVEAPLAVRLRYGDFLKTLRPAAPLPERGSFSVLLHP